MHMTVVRIFVLNQSEATMLVIISLGLQAVDFTSEIGEEFAMTAGVSICVYHVDFSSRNSRIIAYHAILLSLFGVFVELTGVPHASSYWRHVWCINILSR